MKKIIFVKSVSDVEKKTEEVLADHKEGVLAVGSVTRRDAIPEAMQRFREGKLDVLIMPASVAMMGWNFTADEDIEVIVADDVLEPYRTQALGRVRPSRLHRKGN